MTASRNMRKKNRIIRSDASIGQLLIIGFDGTEMSPRLLPCLRGCSPLASSSLPATSPAGNRLTTCSKSARAAFRPHSSLAWTWKADGSIGSATSSGPSPSAADVFATGDRKLFRKHGKVIGDSCRTLGFNTDFAPVVDLALEASKTVMSSRAVSANPKEVVVYAREFLAGIASRRAS